MNVRKMMARLNPSTVRFDVGRGGIPEFTPQDIAAAVGMVRSELAREVFCHVWWPDGAKLTRDRLMAQIAFAQRTELDKQWRAAQVARLDLHIAEEDASTRNFSTDFDRRVLEQLRAKEKEARDRCWPAVPAMWPVVREAALEELSTERVCSKCAGDGATLVMKKPVTCETCGGSGTLRMSDRHRAERLGKDESTYRAKWRGMYEWTFALVSDAEKSAAARIASVLAKCGSDTPAFSE